MKMTEHKTDNGVAIVNGLAVWTNNLELATVVVDDQPRAGNFDGWYDTITFMNWDGTVYPGGRPGAIMNGERMTTQHPFTGEMAADRLALIES